MHSRNKSPKAASGADETKRPLVCETGSKNTVCGDCAGAAYVQRLLGEDQIAGILQICAKDIMQKDPVWVSPQDSVRQVLARMRRGRLAYVLVGGRQTAEGIVTMSDIKAALSPYLRPEFAKWRGPLDDATLRIRIKWIMSAPVRTIKPQTRLTAIMQIMVHFGIQSLPVTDQQDKVLGLVASTDIFRALLAQQICPNTRDPIKEIRATCAFETDRVHNGATSSQTSRLCHP
jgi:CBS domain-containing protein